VTPLSIQHFTMSPHAEFEMGRRGLSEETIRQVPSSPEQRFEVRAGRALLQSRLAMGEPTKIYLVRVVVDINRQPPEVVTAYRTRKLSKYWGDTP
jgi:uncharacterized protein DUF4258